jgi:cytochrome c-type biogenesis protein CcsB
MIILASFMSWVGITFLVWRFGYLLRDLISAFPVTAAALDELTYRLIAIGFPVFTIGGLIFGAVWADQAWGRYWNWDPKETWSLIIWFVYAFYLHAGQTLGWRGNRTAVIAVVGFAVTMFAYLGVNLLLSGLHSYGAQ